MAHGKEAERDREKILHEMRAERRHASGGRNDGGDYGGSGDESRPDAGSGRHSAERRHPASLPARDDEGENAEGARQDVRRVTVQGRAATAQHALHVGPARTRQGRVSLRQGTGAAVRPVRQGAFPHDARACLDVRRRLPFRTASGRPTLHRAGIPLSRARRHRPSDDEGRVIRRRPDA